jgi:ABC-type transport system involved in multi-copper enzyme maturation permease subunit
MELRHTRRLVRYWVFLSIAYLFGLAGYAYYSALHALFSSVSASVGMIGPRYLMMAIGLYYITGFVLGIVFLGFDVRARDVRESIVEVLDSRPLSNFELVGGRFLALSSRCDAPSILRATLRPSCSSCAAYTMPMPPSPSLCSSR